MNDKIKLLTGSGERVEALAPIIISASRSTDIPAFYAEWLIRRLKAGYCVWYNPFNRQPVHVAFENTKAIVFWSKNPRPLIPYLHELDERGIHYYFQFTLNDYGNGPFEPDVPPIEERIKTFRELSGKIGKEKVIWRFDPLVMTDKTGVDELLRKVEHAGNQLNGYTEKLVFSFADIYKKVENRLRRLHINYREFTPQTMNEFATGLRELNKTWNLSLATCAEQIDLKQFGIEHNCCIDGELMKRLFSGDRDLIHYLNYGKLPGKNPLFGRETHLPPINIEKLKDKGQRKLCGCIISKDIGMYNTCPHHCVYCYANTSVETVAHRFSSYGMENESDLTNGR
jgi:DNA repair photolyase